MLFSLFQCLLLKFCLELRLQMILSYVLLVFRLNICFLCCMYISRCFRHYRKRSSKLWNSAIRKLEDLIRSIGLSILFFWKLTPYANLMFHFSFSFFMYGTLFSFSCIFKVSNPFQYWLYTPFLIQMAFI